MMRLLYTIRNGIASAALAGLAAACSHSGEPVQEAGQVSAAAPAPTAPAPVRALVPLPALLKLPVDALPRYLGAPQPLTAAVQQILSELPKTDSPDSLRYFRYRSLQLLVNYDARTRACIDVLLLGRNEHLLMQQAGLSAEATRYLALPVFHVQDPTRLLGVRVVPVEPGRLQ